VAQYDECLAADPEQHCLLKTGHGFEGPWCGTHTTLSIKATDDAAKTAGLEAAKNDFRGGLRNRRLKRLS